MVSTLDKHILRVLISFMLAMMLIEIILILNETHQNNMYTMYPYLMTNHTIMSSLLNYNLSKDKNTTRYCPAVPPDLQGRMKVHKDSITWDFLEKELAYLSLEPGGSFRPKSCVARCHVAIIVPYRAREDNLLLFLYNLHPMLVRQQLDYTIFIVEQEAGLPFNRACLMNVGFTEALKRRQFDCFIFHDVDLIPEDDRNLYRCLNTPRHMSVAVDTFNYRLPYSTIFGGVSAMSKDLFERVNGFGNVYWGWGAEDDDMARRLSAAGLNVSRYSTEIARYTMLKHTAATADPERFNKLNEGPKRFRTDGLSNLRYTVLNSQQYKLYTWFLVRLPTYGLNVTEQNVSDR